MADTKRKTSEVILKYSVDENSVSKADQAAAALLARFDALTAEAAQTVAASRAGADGLQDMARAENDLARSMRDAETAARENLNALDDNVRAVRDYGDEYRRVSQDVEAYGDVGTNLSAASGLLRTAGLGGAADIGLIGADVADAVEGFARLKPALSEIGTRVTGAVNAFTGLNLTVGELALAGGAAGVAIAGAVALLQQSAAEAQRQQEEAANRMASERTGRARGYQEIQTFTEDLLQDRFQDINNQLAGENSARREAYAQAIQLAESWKTQTTEVWYAINSGMLETIDNIDEARAVFDNLNTVIQILPDEGLNKAIGEFGILSDELEGYSGTISELEGEIRVLESEEGRAAIAANTLAEEEAELAQVRQDQAIQAIEEMQAKEEQRVRDYVAGLEEQFEMQRQYADLARELSDIADVSDEIASAKTASAERIAALNDSFNEFVSNAADRIADVNRDLEKQKTALQRDFMQQALEDTQDYLQDEQRAQEDYQRDRVAAIRDMYNDLLSAEESNDVIAFVRAQRAGEERIKQMDDQADVETKRRQEDFIKLQAQRREEYKKELQGLQDAAADRIATIQQEIADRRTLLAQQIQQERAALTQRVQDLYSAAQQEIALRKAQFQQELTLQAQYTQQSLLLQQKLATGLAQVAANAQSQINQIASGFTKSAGSYSSLAYSTASVAPMASASSGPTYSITTGNIGSGVTQSDVYSAIRSAVGLLTTSTLKSYGKI